MKRFVFAFACTILMFLCACQKMPDMKIVPPEAGPQHTPVPITKVEMISLPSLREVTPNRFSYALDEHHWGWSIENASVTLPINLSRFDILEVPCGTVLNLDTLSDKLLRADEESRMENIIIPFGNYWDDGTIQAQSRMLLDGEWLSIGLVTTPGYIYFTRRPPSEYWNTGEIGEMNEAYLSTDGIAKKCEIDPAEAVQKAFDFLDLLDLPIDYQREALVAAYSPSENENDPTALAKGFYQIAVRQNINGKSIASTYYPTGLPAPNEGTIPPLPVRIEMKVFDCGVTDCTIFWLNNQSNTIELVDSILSIDAAAKRVADVIALSNRSTMRRDIFSPVSIHEIRLEYAIEKLEKGVVRLVPCWSFMGNDFDFTGVRINALTGEEMMAVGAIIKRKEVVE